MNDCLSSAKDTDIEEGLFTHSNTIISEEKKHELGEEIKHFFNLDDYGEYFPSSQMVKDFCIQVSSSVTSGLILYVIYKSNN